MGQDVCNYPDKLNLFFESVVEESMNSGKLFSDVNMWTMAPAAKSCMTWLWKPSL